MSDTQNNPNATQASAQEFVIQRLYVKDISLETPGSPELFMLKEWQPNVHLDLKTEAKKIDDKNQEVILTVTVTAKIKEKAAFLIEVQQAGIFTLSGFEKEQLEGMIGAFCPNLLYPYVREVITDLTVRAGFPPLYLQPVNFEALYMQQKQQQAGAAGHA